MSKLSLMEMSKLEENNYKHSFDFVINRNKFNIVNALKSDFSFQRFLTNYNNMSNPDKMNFSLEFRRREDKTALVTAPLKELPFDYYEPIKNFYFDGLFKNELFSSDKPVEIYSNIIEIIKKGDILTITDTSKLNSDDTYTLFIGAVTNIKVKYYNMKIEFDVELEDLTYKGFDNVFESRILNKDKYIYNSADLDNSLLFILCKKLFGTTTNADTLAKIDIPNITYPDGSLKTILYCNWEKGDMIWKHIANIVESFGGKIYMADNILTIRNPLGTNYNNSILDWYSGSGPYTYEFNENNILEYINDSGPVCNYNEVDITYSQYEVAERQKIVQLKGTSGTEKEGEANIIIEANTVLSSNNTWIELNFISDYCINIESTFKTLAHYYTIPGDENSKVELQLVKDTHYNIEYDEAGGKIRFGNPYNSKLFIDTFIIYGQPVMVSEGNTFNYTREEILERNIKTLQVTDNQYIQNVKDAEYLAKYLYFYNCIPNNTIEFKANLCTPLNPNTVVNINHKDLVCQLLVTDVTHNGNSTTIKGVKFSPFILNSYLGGVNAQKNNVDYNILKGLDFISDEIITMDPTAPIAPTNITLVSNFDGFYVKWDEIPTREDIRGYYINVKYVLDGVTSQSETFSATNSKYFPAQYLTNANATIVEYEVKIRTVTFKGIIGNYSNIYKVIPLKNISSGKVLFPTGMTPEELNTKLTTANGNISTLQTNLGALQTNLTTNYATISSLQTSLANINFSSLQGTIGASQILANTITTNMINTGAITAVKIATGTITATQIATDTIVANNIATGAITANEIASGAVTTDKLYARAITSDKIASKTIVAENIASGAITTEKISAGAITANEIGSNAITTEKLVSASITSEKIAVGAITADKILAGTITANEIAAGTITSDHISGNKLEGIEIVSENITKTERIYINSGQVVHQKRNSIQEEYKNYEQLTMMKSGEVRCQNTWSPVVDFKTYNNGLPWSNLNITAFIGAQYDLNTNGIAISNYIIKEWVGDVSEQKMRFKVAGSSYVNTSKNVVNTWVNTNTNEYTYTISDVTSVNFSIQALGAISYHATNNSNSGGALYEYANKTAYVYVRIDNESEIFLGKSWDYASSKVAGTRHLDELYLENFLGGVLSANVSYSKSFSKYTTVRIIVRYVQIAYAFDSYATSDYENITGTIIQATRTDNTIYDATVNWLAIGNS